DMLYNTKLDTVKKLFAIQPAKEEVVNIQPKEPEIFFHRSKNPEAFSQNPKQKKIGRNDPCPCGSGKKYKKCCGRNI
ncbi:SEC-C metal-binding domain-containing protein, partial [Escherichia coli]|uniref:SEC-C metal-binding domain-containing protein n=1 Tax=Escherichia coli TaxID=562 RepID=UPI00128F6A52